MLTLKKYILPYILLFFPTLLFAQSSESKAEFSATIAYQSLAHFLGRTDSLNTSVTVPIISYKLKNGLYAQTAGIFIKNDAIPFQYTGSTFELGYQFMQNDANFSGNVYATYFDYKEKSIVVKSALKYQVGVNTIIKSKIINVNPSFDLKFSDKTDVGLTLGFDHLFIAKLKQGFPRALAFDPTVTFYAGTQNFSESYQKNIGTGFIPIYQTETKEVNKLSLLAIDCTLPIVLVLGKFNTFITPSYVIPFNVLTNYGERVPSRFYFTAGVGIKL